MLTDLSDLRVRDLLQLETRVVAELRSRGLVRTSNKPLADIAERVVLVARGGVLEPNSTKSHDVTDPNGRRIQVKAMGRRAAGRSAKFGSFRSFEFTLAREVREDEIEAVARYSPRTNARQPTLRQIERLGIDVTDEMRAAYDTLDAARLDQP